MEEQGPLDLSALDPELRPERWQAVVDVTLRQVETVLANRPKDPLSLIASWSRPLTVAAGLAVAVLIPVELVLELREPRTERIATLVRLSTGTALGAEPPTGEELSRAVGSDLLR